MQKKSVSKSLLCINWSPMSVKLWKNITHKLKKQQDFIGNVVKTEEERFHETLHDGLEILTDIIKREKEKGSTVFPGTEVFRLYDTYGFPKELTEEYVAEHQFTIDEEGFQVEMEKQRERARSARQKVDSMHVQDDVLADAKVDSTFIGYDTYEVETEIQLILKDAEMVKKAAAGDHISVILKETPFYAESGGQIADEGSLQAKDGLGLVQQVKKSPNGQHIHEVEVKKR